MTEMKSKIKILIIAAALTLSMLATACDSGTEGGPDEGGFPTITDTNGAVIQTKAPDGEEIPVLSNGTVLSTGDNAPAGTGTGTDANFESAMAQIATKGEITTLSEAQASRYAYSSLSDEEKLLYTELVDAVNNYKTKLTASKKHSPETLEKVFKMVYQNEPSLIQMGSKFYNPGTDSKWLSIEYRCTQDECNKMRAEMDEKVKTILSTIPSNASTIEQIYAVHDYLVTNVEFSEADELCKGAYGPLVRGGGNCDGYSKASAYIFDKMGIENVLVLGKNGTGADALSHAWNLINVDGEWYVFDATWDDPANITDPTYLRHNFLMVTDAEILGITHFMTMPYYTPPTASGTKHDYFKTKGLYASSAAEGEEMIKKAVLEAAKTGQKQIQVKFASKAAFDEAHKKLIDNKGLNALLEETNKTSSKKVDTNTYTNHTDKKLLIIHFGVTYK